MSLIKICVCVLGIFYLVTREGGPETGQAAAPTIEASKIVALCRENKETCGSIAQDIAGRSLSSLQEKAQDTIGDVMRGKVK